MLTAAEADEKSVTINIRASRQARDLIDRAAKLNGKTRTEFMLETACREAENALLDQRMYFLDEEQHRAFLAKLDTPSGDVSKLAALLNKKAPWER